jgi:hypothetical protein
MTAAHVVLGTALIVVNALAGVLGGIAWRRGTPLRVFWPLLRTGQALVAIEALDGGILVLMGRELPQLHLIYGLVPLAVSFVAEQLRLVSAAQILENRGLEGRAAVELLTREMGVMAASAGVVALLGVRAAGLL